MAEAKRQSLELFMKKNQIQVENEFIPASKRLLDEDGKPLLWEIKRITTEEQEALRRECSKRVPVPGRRGQYQVELDDSLFSRALAAHCTVYPNLNDKTLQDSYGVMSAEDLITKMLDDPFEYSEYLARIAEHSGLNLSFDDEVEEAKNS